MRRSASLFDVAIFEKPVFIFTMFFGVDVISASDDPSAISSSSLLMAAGMVVGYFCVVSVVFAAATCAVCCATICALRRTSLSNVGQIKNERECRRESVNRPHLPRHR
jgi:hypothetical protein